MPHSNRQNWFTGLSGLLFLFLSGFCVNLIFQSYQIVEQQDNWLLTKAIVTESGSRTVHSPYDDHEECYFRYKYVVDGELFDSSLYDATGGTCVDQLRFKQNDVIEAYYNPNNPGLAVVERRSFLLVEMLPAIITIVLLGGLGILCMISVVSDIWNS